MALQRVEDEEYAIPQYCQHSEETVRLIKVDENGQVEVLEPRKPPSYTPEFWTQEESPSYQPTDAGIWKGGLEDGGRRRSSGTWWYSSSPSATSLLRLSIAIVLVWVVWRMAKKHLVRIKEFVSTQRCPSFLKKQWVQIQSFVGLLKGIQRGARQPAHNDVLSMAKIARETFDQALLADDPEGARKALVRLKDSEEKAFLAEWLQDRIRPLRQEVVEADELDKHRKAMMEELVEAIEASEEALLVYNAEGGGGRGGGGCSWGGPPEDLELRLVVLLAKIKVANYLSEKEKIQEEVDRAERTLQALYQQRDREAVQELQLHRVKCGVAVEKEEGEQQEGRMTRTSVMVSQQQHHEGAAADDMARLALKNEESSSWTIVEELPGSLMEAAATHQVVMEESSVDGSREDTDGSPQQHEIIDPKVIVDVHFAAAGDEAVVAAAAASSALPPTFASTSTKDDESNNGQLVVAGERAIVAASSSSALAVTESGNTQALLGYFSQSVRNELRLSTIVRRISQIEEMLESRRHNRGAQKMKELRAAKIEASVRKDRLRQRMKDLVRERQTHLQRLEQEEKARQQRDQTFLTCLLPADLIIFTVAVYLASGSTTAHGPLLLEALLHLPYHDMFYGTCLPRSASTTRTAAKQHPPAYPYRGARRQPTFTPSLSPLLNADGWLGRYIWPTADIGCYLGRTFVICAGALSIALLHYLLGGLGLGHHRAKIHVAILLYAFRSWFAWLTWRGSFTIRHILFLHALLAIMVWYDKGYAYRHRQLVIYCIIPVLSVMIATYDACVYIDHKHLLSALSVMFGALHDEITAASSWS